MSRQTISVAMCTYNGVRYVREQLQSIAGQTTTPNELIVSDDASSDGTADLVQELAARSSLRTRLVRNPATLGCARNFERAIRLCGGDIIVLADQDDVWKPDKLTVIAAAFERHPEAGYIFSNADIINESGGLLGLSLWQTVGFEPQQFVNSLQVETLLKRNLVTGAAMAFRSSLRDILLPIPEGWGHDYWIALLGSIFGSGVPIQEHLFLYRRHLGQQMGCGKDTLLAKIKTSLAAGPDYCAKAARIAELWQRVEACARTMNCPPDHLRLVKEKQLHLSRRALIRSAHGRARIVRLISEAASGRYQRFSSSWGSVIRDLTAAAPFR